jgi:hypothetical protein
MVKSATDVLTDKLKVAGDLLADAQRNYEATWDKWQEVLHALNLLADTVASATDSAVTGARAAGLSWAQIALPLGRTKQSVQQRYGGPE